MAARLKSFFLLGTFLVAVLFTPGPVMAAISLTFSGAPSTTEEESPFEIDVSLLNAPANRTYYLRAAFHQEGQTQYFGYTFNHLDSWHNLAGEHTGFLRIVTGSEGSWSGKLKAKADLADSAFKGAGSYGFKIGRYTEGGSLSWSENNSVIIINLQPTPTPTPTLTPMPTNTPTPEPTNTSTPTPTPVTPTSTNTPTPTSTLTPTPTKKPTPTLTSTPTPTPVHTPTPKPTPTSTIQPPTPTPTRIPTATPTIVVPSPTATPSFPKATSTQGPTSQPAVTPSPAPTVLGVSAKNDLTLFPKILIGGGLILLTVSIGFLLFPMIRGYNDPGNKGTNNE